MKKAITVLLAIAVAAAVFIIMPVLSFATEETPNAEIVGYNLIVSDNVYISYGVRFENSDGLTCGLLVWSEYRDDYTYADAEYRLSSVGKSGDLQVFEFRNITVKQMTDDFYARAYVLKDGVYYYSQVKKYSILQYAYNKLGYTGTRTENEDLVNYLNSMLKYGGRTQTYENYHTERLASDPYSKVSVVGGSLPDGFSFGLCRQGTTVTLSSDFDGEHTSWFDADGIPILDAKDLSLTVGDKNAVYTAEKVINAVVFGDGFLTANCMGDTVAKFAEADGEKLNVVCARTTDNIEPDPSTRLSTWHLYSWDGTTLLGDGTSGPNTRFFRAIDGEQGKIDYLWIETSRDWGTSNNADEKTKMERAFTALYERAVSANPGISISLINPAGFQDGNQRPYVTSYNPSGTRSGHNKRINDFAKRLSDAVGGCDQVRIGDAFEYFLETKNYDELYDVDLYDPLKSFPSIAGSYYAACVLYSTVTGRATTGMPFCGYLDADTAAALQAASDEFLASRSVVLTPHGSDRSYLPMTLYGADPRNRPADPDPAFADDSAQYPDNYDVLLSSAYAYYARGKFTQYDNKGMGKAGTGSTAYRRTTNPDKSSPEDATSQSILYTDCSAYIYSVMCDAFTDFNFGGKNRCTTIFQYYYEDATYGLGGTNLWPKNHDPADPPEDPEDPEYMSPAEMKPPAPKNLVPYVWRQRSDNPDLDRDVALADSAAIKAVLRPGDVIVFANESRDLSVGHIMLYMGNGIMLHSTGLHAFGGGENYLYQVGTEDYEMNGGIRYDRVTDTTDVGEWLCPFMQKNWVCMVIRPDYGNYTVSAKASARSNGLTDTVAYKETTAPEGVSVSPNGDVTFTVVIYNYGLSNKTYTVTDTIPANFDYVSGPGFTRSGSSLSATVTLAPQETRRLSYTLRVKSTVAARTVIECKNTYVNGVLLGNARVWVAPTLTGAEQTAIKSLLASRGPSASTDIGLVRSIYSGLTFTTKEEAFDSVFETHTGSTWVTYVKNGYYVLLNAYDPSTARASLAWSLFGGQGYMTRTQDSFDRIKHISTENMVAGDLLFTVDNDNDKIAGKDIRVYVYAGDGRLATVENGEYVLYSVSRSQAITESLLAKYAYFVLRPSIQGGSPVA